MKRYIHLLFCLMLVACSGEPEENDEFSYPLNPQLIPDNGIVLDYHSIPEDRMLTIDELPSSLAIREITWLYFKWPAAEDYVVSFVYEGRTICEIRELWSAPYSFIYYGDGSEADRNMVHDFFQYGSNRLGVRDVYLPDFEVDKSLMYASATPPDGFENHPKSEMPKWLSSWVTNQEKMSFSKTYKIIQGERNGETIYFINNQDYGRSDTGLPPSGYPPTCLCYFFTSNGRNITFSKASEVVDFLQSTSNWKLLYVAQ